MLTFAKDIWNKRTGKITNWEEFDEIEDIITEEEREFLQMYRCETLEIEELLYYFVNSGQFGDYESFFYQESDDSDIEFEIMKKNPQKTEETNFEDDFQYLTLAEWNSLLQDIMKDSKFVCSICWEKFFDENELKDFVFLNPPERENALNDNEDEIQTVGFNLKLKPQIDEVHRTECSHYFHKKCLAKWCESEKSTCPLCRKLAVTENIEININD